MNDSSPPSAIRDPISMPHESTPSSSRGSDKTVATQSGSADSSLPTDWRYLTWDTPSLPQPNTLYNEAQRPDLPSTTSYERYVSPFLWSRTRKNVTITLSCIATVITAGTAGSYLAGEGQMIDEWQISRVEINLGVTIFTIGFAIAPMVVAPFSEIQGRRPVFVVTGLLFAILQLCCGLTRSFAGLLVARFLTGCVSSTFSTMVGGVVSDIYMAEERNTPMALFTGAAMFGTGFGPMVSGFIAANLSWRWIFYIQSMWCFVLIAAIFFFFKETRGSVLLSRKAAAMNRYYDELEDFAENAVNETEKTTPANTSRRRIRWKVKSDEERSTVLRMIKISVSRPFLLLFTEPTIFFFSLWISFSWMILYLTFGAIPLVFGSLYGFDVQEAGAVFAALCIAALISTVVAIFGDRALRKRRPEMMKTPEGRLFSPCIQSCLLPIGLFWFGWSSYRSVHWIMPAIGLGIATSGIFSVYLCTFNYLSDCYSEYASSSLAAQSCCRNLLGGCIPLFVAAMYNRLGYQGASSLLGGLGIILTAVPFILLFYGPRIRARSKFANSP